ncbi:MAG: exodeoxyribonuclease V subunit gamma [Verrucomicrobiota bacterium]|nr:exodeoxyribonuclease V subunit gamma [Verrucomicrobiota bacterium]
MRRLFFSHRLEQLAIFLASQVAGRDPKVSLFTPQIVLVPSAAMKQWLLLSCADQNGSVIGCEVYTLQEGLSRLFPKLPSFAECFFALFEALSSLSFPLVANYVQTEERRVELAYELAQILLRARREPGMDPCHLEGWQGDLFRKVFTERQWKDYSSALKEPLDKSIPIHCFGFQFLPAALLEGLFSFDVLSLYLFSPSLHYHGDLCSVREKEKLKKYWHVRGATEATWQELEHYLSDAPQLLANWGKLGREMLKLLERFEWDLVEDYPIEEPSSHLQRVQAAILHFQAHPSPSEKDASLVLLPAGSSRLSEIEALRERIGHLLAKRDLSPREILVLSPDIHLHAPFIETFFIDLPYRIFGGDSIAKTFIYRGVQTLIQLAHWNLESLLLLLENPAFTKKWGELSALRSWLSERRGWEDELLEELIFLLPKRQGMPGSFADVEGWISLLRTLRRDLSSLKDWKTPAEWACCLQGLMEKHLFVDSEKEMEESAWHSLQRSLQQLQHITSAPAPLSLIEVWLKRQSFFKDIHASHLHAITFASLDEGNLLPARHLFLIGMDEESYPRKKNYSSIDPFPSFQIERERSLLLQALFSARESLQISYTHLTPHEGKKVFPSFLLEELFLYAPPLEERQKLHKDGIPLPQFSWPIAPVSLLPEGEVSVSMTDLRALMRHPWDFYLRKEWGLDLREEEVDSFSLQKHAACREEWRGKEVSAEELAPGIWGEALKEEVKKRVAAWRAKTELVPEPLVLQMKKNALRVQVSEKLVVFLTGEIPFSSGGFLHLGEDSFRGLLRSFPDCLVGAKMTGCMDIHCLETGRVRRLEEVEGALSALLVYYFSALSAPSPFLLDWAEKILQKGEIPEKTPYFDDPVFQWVEGRKLLPPLDKWAFSWASLLQRSFAPLLKLYTQEKSDAPSF